MTDRNKKETIKMVHGAQRLLHKNLTDSLPFDEEPAGYTRLGKEITKAVFNYVCPETGALVNSVGFLAHGNVNPETGDTEAIVTVECKSCNKEHPVLALSFSEMLSMPFIEA